MSRSFMVVTAADTGDNSAAERNFQQVASSGNRELASVAKLALASLYANSRRTKEAVEIYQKLMAEPTASRSKVTAQLQLAELYQASNQPLDAHRIDEPTHK